jgi:TonB-dependent SusC/RagA subfamily outer membrane receptor
MIRLRNSWLAVLACCSAMPLGAQDTPEPDPAPSYTTLARANYRPLDAVRRGRVAMPAKLSRKVSLTRHRVLLQQALLDIANQAGFGLSYGEDLVRSQTLVSLDVRAVSAADALAAVVQGTGWAVFVNPAAQVTVVKAPGQRAGAVTGLVTDAKTGQGVGSVEVFLDATEWRTTTDTSGRYRLAEVDAGTYTLTARRPGYAKQSRRVTVRAEGVDTVDLVLEPVALKLDELVTTATGRQRRRDLGNAITTIHADSVLQTAPIRSLTDLLEDRVPGLTVQHTSGAPGDPARLRLRGLGSVLRSNDPVVVVDGVRVYATQSEQRSGNLTNLAPKGPGVMFGNAPAPSPLDQIDPNIIEKIEVFKGPSAATLYGADAANGVIVITTKKGRPGPTRWNASVTHGRTSLPGRWPEGYYRWGHVPLAGGGTVICPLIDLTCVPDSLVRFQALNDPDLTILGQGRLTTLSVTASGGNQALTYSITGTYGDETGYLRLPAFEVERFHERFNRDAPDWMRKPHRLERWSVTNNVSARLGTTADVGLSASVSRTDQQRSTLEESVARVAGMYVDPVSGAYYEASGGTEFGYDLTPITDFPVSYNQRTTASAINFTAGINANWRPRSWFSASGQAGINAIPRDDESFVPAGIVSATDSGALSRGLGRSLVSTFNLQGTLRKPVGWGFVFETNVGANLTTTNTKDLVSSAFGLRPGTRTVAGALRVAVNELQANTSSFGWYIEPRIAGQRLSLSTGIRLDGGSAYGTRLTRSGGLGNLLSLPKLNGSWVISEEPFFPFNSLFSSLRLRAAYGQAQVQPGPADRLRLYTGRVSTSGQSLLLTGIGNTELRPERSVEFEGGVDADVLDGKLTVELTAYRKTQIDALMRVALPTSVNGGGDVFQNIGNIRNQGLELTLGLTPIRLPALTWNTQLTYSRNTNTLVKLGNGVVANRQTGIVEGYPVGGRWARPILGYADQNENGVLELTEIQVGDSMDYMGRLLPDYTTALFTNVALFGGAVGITAGFSYEAGATQIDETAVTNWVFARPLADPTASYSDQAAVVASIGENAITKYGVIQDVSTFQFASLSINYRAPTHVARFLRAQQLTIGLRGSNLGLHSTYRGKDPDVNTWSPGENIRDTGQLPRPRTWQLALSLQY